MGRRHTELAHLLTRRPYTQPTASPDSTASRSMNSALSVSRRAARRLATALLALAVAAPALLLATPAHAQGTATRTDFATGLTRPYGLVQLTDGRILVAETSAARVSVLSATGTRTDFATGLVAPYGLVQLTDGRILVAEVNASRVSVLSATGTRTNFATGLNAPIDLVQLADGRILVAELNGNRVSNITAGTRSDFATGLSSPLDLVQLANGRILVAESGAARVSDITAGARSDFATGLIGPYGLVQLTDGRILVSEFSGNRVSLLTLSTTMTVAQAGLYNPSSNQGDGAGFRLLGAPVPGLTPTSLAALNLVQGIPAGANAATHPAQYAAAGANLFTGYTGLNYTRPDTDDPLVPGRGFWWNLYDITVASASVPAQFGTGTSSSVELTGFALSATGVPTTADVSVPFADNGGAGRDDFQMLANPFARALAVSGITASGGVVQGTDVVQAYNPNGRTYVPRIGTDRLAVWQGVFAQLVPTAPGGTVTVTYAYASTDTNPAPTFYGRGVAEAARPSVRFALAGELSDGTPVADSAAIVRFDAAATAGWDGFDVSKLTPPVAAYAMLAPVALRNGEPARLAVDTRAAGSVAVVPLAFTSTGAGRFTLTWTTDLPTETTATLYDAATGRTVDLAAGASLAFETMAAQEWAERFTLTVAPGGVTAGADGAEAAFGLSAARPNPASSRASMVLTLDRPQRVRAVIVDALGRTVAVLHDGEAAGVVALVVDAGALAPGVYVVRVAGAEATLSRRITVAR